MNISNNNCDKVFKNGPSKICGRQPLKKLKGFFKGCLPQILLGPFLNTLSQLRWFCQFSLLVKIGSILILNSLNSSCNFKCNFVDQNIFGCVQIIREYCYFNLSCYLFFARFYQIIIFVA